jgi:hypothetical protein
VVQLGFTIKCPVPREASHLGWVLLKMERTIQARRNMQAPPRRLRKGLISPNFWYLSTDHSYNQIYVCILFCIDDFIHLCRTGWCLCCQGSWTRRGARFVHKHWTWGPSIEPIGHRTAPFLFVHLLTPPSFDKFRQIMEPLSQRWVLRYYHSFELFGKPLQANNSYSTNFQS